MTDPDRDRIHADLLLAEKRGKAALKKAEATRDQMASRLDTLNQMRFMARDTEGKRLQYQDLKVGA